MNLSRRLPAMALAAAALALPALSAPVAAAATTTYSVTTTADTPAFDAATGCSTTSSVDGACSLRSAVQSANATPGAAVIDLPADSYTLTIGTPLKVKRGRVTISGAGPAETTIDANLLNRAFGVDPGATLELDGVTVTNGRTPALAGETACPTVADLPAANEGGAILDRGTLTLSNDVIENSMASGNGGGISDRSEDGTLSISDTTITGNATCDYRSVEPAVTDRAVHRHHNRKRIAHALPRTIIPASPPSFGGGIFACGCSTMNITDSTITDNATPTDSYGPSGGGGIAVRGSGPFRITDSTIAGNTSSSGAGIAAVASDEVSGSLYLSGDTISDNTASATNFHPFARRASARRPRILGPIGQAFGGGVADYGFDVTLRNSTVTGNVATDGGGIGSARWGSVTVSFSTIADNTASSSEFDSPTPFQSGNLEAEFGGSFTLDDSIVAFGQSPTDDPTNCGAAEDSGFTSAGNNLFDDTADSGSQCGAGATDIVSGTTGLGTLTNNGGPTETMALQAGSPAIDAANDDLCATETHGVDQRGVTRPQAAHCDIGAFEYESADLVLTSSDPSSTFDVGQQSTVTDTITNSGPSTADGVTFTDPAAGGFTIVSATSTVGTCTHTGTTVSCSIGSLASGATATITIIVSGTSAGPVTLTATVSSTTPDPTSTNNTATVNLTIDPAPVPAVVTTPATTPSTPPMESADLAVSQSFSHLRVIRGHRTTFTVTVTNEGPSADTGVTLVYKVPRILRWVASHPSRGVTCAHRGGRLTCTVGSLASGGRAQVRVVVIPTRTGTVSDSAHVLGSVADPNLSNNTNTATVTVTEPPCTANLVFTSAWMSSEKVGTVRIYVDGTLTRALHGADIRRVKIASPPMTGTHTVTVAFVIGPFETMTETRSFHDCTSGATRYEYPPQTDPGAS